MSPLGDGSTGESSVKGGGEADSGDGGWASRLAGATGADGRERRGACRRWRGRTSRRGSLVAGGARRAAAVGALGGEVGKDRGDGLGLGDERDDPHRAAAAGAKQGIHLVDSADALGPTAAQFERVSVGRHSATESPPSFDRSLNLQLDRFSGFGSAEGGADCAARTPPPR